MKNRVDLVHWESFLDFDDEKVDGLLITLKNVNGVIAFANENLILFGRKEFGKFAITDGGASKLERCVEKRDVSWELSSNDPGTNLNSFENLLYFLLILNFEGFQSRVLESGIIPFCDILFDGFSFQIVLNFLDGFQEWKILVSSTNLFILLFFELFQQLNDWKNTHLRFVGNFLLVVFLKRKHCQMLHYYWVSLLPSGSLVGDSVEWPFDGEDSHSGIVSVVDTDPSEAHGFDSLL